MGIPALTLDTNLLHRFWKQQPKARVVEQLLFLAEQGKVDLAVTRRVHDDIPEPPLADRLNELPTLKVRETGVEARVGDWVLGEDMIGDDAFERYRSTACEMAQKRGKKPPDWRDWSHLHGHYLAHRDVFLTWDGGILCLRKELRERFGIVVMTPEEYIETFDGDPSQ